MPTAAVADCFDGAKVIRIREEFYTHVLIGKVVDPFALDELVYPMVAAMRVEKIAFDRQTPSRDGPKTVQAMILRDIWDGRPLFVEFWDKDFRPTKIGECCLLMEWRRLSALNQFDKDRMVALQGTGSVPEGAEWRWRSPRVFSLSQDMLREAINSGGPVEFRDGSAALQRGFQAVGKDHCWRCGSIYYKKNNNGNVFVKCSLSYCDGSMQMTHIDARPVQLQVLAADTRLQIGESLVRVDLCRGHHQIPVPPQLARLALEGQASWPLR